MNWLDILLSLVLIGSAAVGLFRGFGRTVFDALAVYASLWIASTLCDPLAAGIHFQKDAAANHALAYGLLLAAFMGLMLLLSRFVYGATQIHSGMFEGFGGLLSGGALGLMVGHGLVRAIVLADPSGHGAALLVAGGFMGHELLTFQTYHSVIDELTGLTGHGRDLPDMTGK